MKTIKTHKTVLVGKNRLKNSLAYFFKFRNEGNYENFKRVFCPIQHQ